MLLPMSLLLSSAFGLLRLLILLASVLPGPGMVLTFGLSDEVGDRMQLGAGRKPSYDIHSPV